MAKRAQSAMEYLMTYGWSILLIAIVVAALFSLGIFNNASLGPRAPTGSCKVFRPYGAGTITSINLEGVCNGELPEYVAQFNGASSSVVVGNSVALQPLSLTYSSWIYVEGATASNYEAFLSEHIYGHNYGFFETVSTSGQLCAYIETSTGSETTLPSSSCPTGYQLTQDTWYNIVMTYNSGSFNLYVNGQVVGTSSSPVAMTYESQDNFVIGSFTAGQPAGAYFDGLISNVQGYNTVLDANTIQALYLEGIGGAPIEPQYLVTWQPLNGDTNDYSGNGNNGAATNLVFTNSWISGYTTP